MCDSHFIQPDYLKDILDVYRETALAILFPRDPNLIADSSLNSHKHPVMGVLSKAERTVIKYTLPSWVPDWRPLPYEDFWQRISGNGYNAAGMSETRISLTGDPNKISLAAKIGDAVHLVSSIAPEADAISSPFRASTHEEWRGYFSRRVSQSCWINESSSIAAGCPRYRDAAFGSTLIGNRAVEHSTDPLIGQEVEENIDYPLRYWHFRQFLHKPYPNGVVTGAGNPQLQQILGQHMKGHAMFERDYVANNQGRRFFNSLGGYMGIGPPSVRPDDSMRISGRKRPVGGETRRG